MAAHEPPHGTDSSGVAGRRTIWRVGRPVVVLGLVSLCTDISSELIYPLVPLFLTVTLGAPMAAVGVVEGVAESTASLLKVASGWYSDRVRRRLPLVILGYACSAVAKPAMALAFVWPFVIFVRFVDRFGKGIRTSPRDALIADLTLPHLRGRAFGLHRALDTTGAVVGPLLALALLSVFNENFRPIFLIAFGPAAAGLALLALVREEPRRQSPPQRSQPAFALSDFSQAYRLFLLVSLVFALGNSSDAFLLLRARDVGLGTSAVVLAYVLFNGTYALLAAPAGAVSDHLGRRNVIVAGFVLFAVVYFGLAVVASPLWIWLLFGLYGVYMALTEGVGRALVSDLAPSQRRATALGLYHTTLGVAGLLASVAAGLLWDAAGSAAPFALGGSTAVLAALLMAMLLSRRQVALT